MRSYRIGKYIELNRKKIKLLKKYSKNPLRYKVSMDDIIEIDNQIRKIERTGENRVHTNFAFVTFEREVDVEEIIQEY